jgi:hypothetical protein
MRPGGGALRFFRGRIVGFARRSGLADDAVAVPVGVPVVPGIFTLDVRTVTRVDRLGTGAEMRIESWCGRFSVDLRVRGSVRTHTAREIPRKTLWREFNETLEGVSAVSERERESPGWTAPS